VHYHPNLIFSVGTQVVTLADIPGSAGLVLHPRGTVGIVVKAPTDHEHSYRVRFPDGFEAPLKRNEVTMLAKFKEGEIGDTAHVAQTDLYQRVLYRCVIGSQAYGLADAASDVDRRGIYLPTAEQQWSLYGVPEQLENHETQEAYWELQKFLVLALKANPNVLECLYTPLIEKATPLAEELLAMKSIFLPMIPMPLLKKQIEEHPYPLLFATISGAHLYGFPSPDSDFDLRGVHVLPLREIVGLQTGPETIERSGVQDGLEIDLVTHDAKKFFALLLKKNGYVLEQVLSPLVVHTTPEHAELKEIATQSLTRHHAHHYLGFAETQWKLFEKENPPRVKPLLYVYRVLLTGIHLMRSGIVEANLVRLNETVKLPYLDDLIQRKVAGAEKERLSEPDVGFHRSEYDRLRQKLQQASEASDLPEGPRGSTALHDLLVRLRVSERG
jgi:predicted nucleotidyltransferase